MVDLHAMALPLHACGGDEDHWRQGDKDHGHASISLSGMEATRTHGRASLSGMEATRRAPRTDLVACARFGQRLGEIRWRAAGSDGGQPNPMEVSVS